MENTQYFGEKGRNYEGEPDFICLCFSILHSLHIDYMLYLLLYIKISSGKTFGEKYIFFHPIVGQILKRS